MRRELAQMRPKENLSTTLDRRSTFTITDPGRPSPPQAVVKPLLGIVTSLIPSGPDEISHVWSEKVHIEHFHWHHAVLQHGRRIAQTDLDIQGSHAHHARMRETITHNNVKRFLHKWILIAVAIEAAMLEDSMKSHENALLINHAKPTGYPQSPKSYWLHWSFTVLICLFWFTPVEPCYNEDFGTMKISTLPCYIRVNDR